MLITDWNGKYASGLPRKYILQYKQTEILNIKTYFLLIG